MRLGFGEILVILVVVLLVFGSSKVPQLGEALGKGIRNFKKAQREDDSIDVTPAPKDAEKLSPGAERAAAPSAAASEARKA